MHKAPIMQHANLDDEQRFSLYFLKLCWRITFTTVLGTSDSLAYKS